jgi:hypothetical protein
VSPVHVPDRQTVEGAVDSFVAELETRLRSLATLRSCGCFDRVIAGGRLRRDSGSVAVERRTARKPQCADPPPPILLRSLRRCIWIEARELTLNYFKVKCPIYLCIYFYC